MSEEQSLMMYVFMTESYFEAGVQVVCAMVVSMPLMWWLMRRDVGFKKGNR